MVHSHTMKNFAIGKHLLGKTAKEITRIIGEPFASYTFHDEEVYLYESGQISTIALRKGFVVTCDELADTRRTIRVHPFEKVPVLINGEKKSQGTLRDISVAGAAIQHSHEEGYFIGNRLEISFALPIEGISRYFQIPCRVHEIRYSTGTYVSIFLFDHTQYPWKKRLLSRYVQLCSIMMELGLPNSFSRYS